jgi:hypothetical protein
MFASLELAGALQTFKRISKIKNDVFHAFRGMESCLFFFSDGEETPYKRKVAC